MRNWRHFTLSVIFSNSHLPCSRSSLPHTHPRTSGCWTACPCTCSYKYNIRYSISTVACSIRLPYFSICPTNTYRDPPNIDYLPYLPYASKSITHDGLWAISSYIIVMIFSSGTPWALSTWNACAVSAWLIYWLIIDWLLIIDYWILIIDYWLSIGYRLIIDYWIIGYSDPYSWVTGPHHRQHG